VGVAGFLVVQRLLGGPGTMVTLRTMGSSDERVVVHAKGLADG